MKQNEVTALVEKILAAIEKRVPDYLSVEADRRLNDGNCSVCIIDDAGGVHGKMFGTDKIRQRSTFLTAWRKASQVWITGLKTGEYEKLVFTGKIDEHKFGIIRPDFIGWEGGQPIVLDAGTTLAVGFSGFRGITDVELVQKAVADVMS